MTALLLPGETLHVGVNVIMRPGDLIRCFKCEMVFDYYCPDCDYVAPQDWVALTGPCPTCEGDKFWLDWETKADSGVVPCPDCRDGRRIVPLYTECHDCAGIGGYHGRVLVGRAAVVSIEPEDDGQNFRITLGVVELAA